MTFIKRADLGRPLTWDELDSNFEQVDSYAAAASASASAAQTQAQSASQSAQQSAQYKQDAEAAAASAEGAVDDLRQELSESGGADGIGAASGETVQKELDTLTSYSATKRLDLFKYKIVKKLAAVPPLMAQIVAAQGYQYLYPQGFCYGKNGDIWINMSSNGGIATWATKYNANGDCVASFNAITGTSETIHFYSENGVDYIVVGGKGKLRFFDVTNLPDGSSVQTPVKEQNPDVNFAGCGFGRGRMLLDEQKPPLNTVTNRDRLFVWNMNTAKREQSVTLPLSIAGAASGTPYQDVTHKTQGYAAAPEGLYLSHGKNSTPTDDTVQGATGLSLMNWQGNAESTGLITAKVFAEFLSSQGTATPSRIENEGVAIGADGFPHILQNYLTGSNPAVTTEGIVICSVGDPVGSVDLSHGAIAPLTATYYGVSAGNVVVNPYTGEVMDTLVKIFDYMLATNTTEYNFYTTNATVTDLDGAVFPPSTLVRIYNPNNYAFFYEVINTSSRTLWYGITPTYEKKYATWSGLGVLGDLTNTITGNGTGVLTTGKWNTLYGQLSGSQLSTGYGNTDVGQGAGQFATTATNQTNIGRNAGRWQLDGVTANNFDNSTAIGNDSRVSGANQIQIGGAGTTPYAYNAVQLRSDIRDKWQVRPTELGIDFIMGLNPVQGRWNLRETYVSHEEVQTGVGTGPDGEEVPVYETISHFDEEGYLAGAKAGTRFHNWFISQEVDALCKKQKVDFAGFQDHKVNGGFDVMTLGYEEFIPPMVKAIQQCWVRADEQDKKISALEEHLAKLMENKS